jgi:hypothetical protein
MIPLFLIFLTVFAGPINGALTQTHELQVPGATETYFRPAQNFCLSGFGTPCLQEFFEQKYAVAFMVTQGDSSDCHLKWCNDSGANRHISGDLSDFKPDTVRSVNIQITVAKAGVSMQATAIGDCDLHTLDNMDRPCVISCKDTLFVPGVAKNLLSHVIKYGISESLDMLIRADIFPIHQMGVYAYDGQSKTSITNRAKGDRPSQRNDKLET